MGDLKFTLVQLGYGKGNENHFILELHFAFVSYGTTVKSIVFLNDKPENHSVSNLNPHTNQIKFCK